MQEGIGYQLPDPDAEHDQRGHQSEMKLDPAFRAFREGAQQQHRHDIPLALAMSNCFTARVKGGKLNPMLEVRRMTIIF